VVEYLACANGAEAARNAGYSENTAKQMARENLTKPYLVAAIEAKRSELMKDTEDKVQWLINRLEAEATSQDNNEATRVRSLELLLKVHGGFAPEKTEVTSFDGTFLADLDEEATEVPNEINGLH
tara:strand:+ start:2523 stop:2897 length:375 start_codon:yes stop_codon:yes gene_type:complete